tara:strand:- start:974 stop:1696 length:723 start_codon:yes stop_codon:yes gene_type:complete
MDFFFKKNSVAITFIVVIIGMALAIAGQLIATPSQISISTLIANFGAFVALIGSMNLFYELFTRRQFMHEVRDNVIGSLNIRVSGLTDFTPDSVKYDFNKEILQSRKITLVFNFSSRFLRDYHATLKTFLTRGGEIELFVLKEGGQSTNHMVQMGYDKSFLDSNYKKLHSTIESFKEFKTNIKTTYVDVNIKYAAILFDNIGFMILSTTAPHRTHVPLLKFEKPGTIWDFVSEDIRRLGE